MGLCSLDDQQTRFEIQLMEPQDVYTIYSLFFRSVLPHVSNYVCSGATIKALLVSCLCFPFVFDVELNEG